MDVGRVDGAAHMRNVSLLFSIDDYYWLVKYITNFTVRQNLYKICKNYYFFRIFEKTEQLLIFGIIRTLLYIGSLYIGNSFIGILAIPGFF